jgi:hypothetical protein
MQSESRSHLTHPLFSLNGFTILAIADVRSAMYNFLSDTTWDDCDPATNDESPVCVEDGTGKNVLEGIGLTYAVVTNEDQVVQDIGVMIAIAAVYKVLYILGVVYKTTRVSKIHE